MKITSILIPDIDIIFLIPVNLKNDLKKKDNNVTSLLEYYKKKEIIKEYEVPMEVLKKGTNALGKHQILKIMYESDIDYFDSDYLELKRFGRALVEESKIIIPTRNGEKEINMMVFLTVFEVGIGILVIWLPDITNIYKEDLIDIYFINYKKVRLPSEDDSTTEVILLDYIINFITNRFGRGSLEKPKEILEDMFTMIFVKGIKAQSDGLPYSFISEYEGLIFDVLTFPERYYPKDPEARNSPSSYTYYRTRTKEYVREVLNNISVRHDFPVFVSNNRFLGIKIHTSDRDYWTEKRIKPLTKRIVFNLTLYSNAVLQLKLLKNINNRLSETIKTTAEASLNELVKMREEIFKDLEEYINTSIQRYEVWRKAMEDAMNELNIPDLYNAVKERLEMLNSFISAEHQRSSERLFFLLNTLLIISSAVSLIEAFVANVDIYIKAIAVILSVIIWLAITYRYIKRYIL